MYRTRVYRRKSRARVINRKKNIIKAQNDYWHVPYDGMLSKGKIHCSCPLCRHKSYDSAKMQDVRVGLNNTQDIEDMVNEGYIDGSIASRLTNKISHDIRRS